MAAASADESRSDGAAAPPTATTCEALTLMEEVAGDASAVVVAIEASTPLTSLHYSSASSVVSPSTTTYSHSDNSGAESLNAADAVEGRLLCNILDNDDGVDDCEAAAHRRRTNAIDDGAVVVDGDPMLFFAASSPEQRHHYAPIDDGERSPSLFQQRRRRRYEADGDDNDDRAPNATTFDVGGDAFELLADEDYLLYAPRAPIALY